jgi:hypothetical protein
MFECAPDVIGCVNKHKKSILLCLGISLTVVCLFVIKAILGRQGGLNRPLQGMALCGFGESKHTPYMSASVDSNGLVTVSCTRSNKNYLLSKSLTSPGWRIGKQGVVLLENSNRVWICGSNSLKLIVFDEQGNSASYEADQFKDIPEILKSSRNLNFAKALFPSNSGQ